MTNGLLRRGYGGNKGAVAIRFELGPAKDGPSVVVVLFSCFKWWYRDLSQLLLLTLTTLHNSQATAEVSSFEFHHLPTPTKAKPLHAKPCVPSKDFQRFPRFLRFPKFLKVSWKKHVKPTQTNHHAKDERRRAWGRSSYCFMNVHLAAGQEKQGLQKEGQWRGTVVTGV